MFKSHAVELSISVSPEAIASSEAEADLSKQPSDLSTYVNSHKRSSCNALGFA
jgi:hypothetical protein